MGTMGAERVIGGRPYPRPPNRPGKVLAHKTAANRASHRQGSSVNSPRRILAGSSHQFPMRTKATREQGAVLVYDMLFALGIFCHHRRGLPVIRRSW
jgi:hypothetical protein